MRGPILRLMTSALILNVALLPLMLNAQARSPPRDVEPDGSVHPGDVATLAGPSGNESLPLEPERIFLRIDVYGNGTAAWRIEYWMPLENRTSTEPEFERFNRNSEQGTSATSRRFYERVRRGVAAAEDATGRKMSVTDPDTHTTVRQIPKRYGVVVYSFRWRGFANASDDRLRVGDALRGLYLGSGHHLVISWPSEYELAEVDPAPDTKKNRTVIWHGPTVFGHDGPRLLLVERSGSRSAYFPVTMAVVAIVTALWWVRRPDDAPLTPARIRAFTDDSDESELLSNEEQVIRCLEKHGGRVKQRKVADELGWTPSKTSYVVSNLRDEGKIDTFRLGHENVLSLSDSQTRPSTETTSSSRR